MDNIENKEELYRLLKELSDKYDIYIAGAGRYGDILGKWMNQNELAWKGYIDRSNTGEYLNGKEIYSTFGAKRESDYFFISSPVYYGEIKKDLIEQGVLNEQINGFNDVQLLFEIYEDIVDWKSYTIKIKKFYNCHKNEKRCFIVGNGPSLKIDDLEKLQGEISFACNSIYAVYEKTKWRPNYYCITDKVFWDVFDNIDKVKKILLGIEAAFFSVTGKCIDFSSLTNVYYYRGMYLTDKSNGFTLFSNNCSDVIYTGGTVTYIMLQLAIYMGFKEVYLLGIDFTFSNERRDGKVVKSQNIVNHMEEIEKEERETFNGAVIKKYGMTYFADVDKQEKSYLSARKYADKHGIKIYNATRGGKLEIFERVDFDSLF